MEDDRSQEWLELYRPEDPDPDLSVSPEWQARLTGSDELRRQLETIAAVDGRVRRAMLAIEPSEGLRDKVLLSVGRDRPSVRFGRRRLAAAVGAALAASVLVLAFLWKTSDPAWTIPAVGAKAEVLFAIELPRSPLSDSELGDDWPIGWDAGRCLGAGEVQFLNSVVRFYDFQSGERTARVFVLPADRFSPSIDWSSPYYPASGACFVHFSRNDAFVYVSVMGSEPDLELFRPANTFT